MASRFDVQPGEIVALLGRNGSGRSTTAKAIMGLVDCGRRHALEGQEAWRAKKPSRLPTWAWAMCPRAAISSPSSRCSRTCCWGKKAVAKAAAGRLTTCTTCFRASRSGATSEAGVLSGGEQQMLTLCRTLMGDPDLIIIDEPTEGLAPKIVELVAQYLQDAQSARASRCC